jgi:transposase
MAISTPNKYLVKLSPEERERLEGITRNGHASAKKIRHAQVLLWSDGNRKGGRLSSREIAERLGMHDNTVDRIRKRFVLEGEAPALNRKQRATPAVEPKIDGRVEAHLVAICCGPAPEGQTRWTLSLLANELTKRGLVTSVCAETVRKTLKKTSCSLGASNAGACPSETVPASSRRWKTSSTCTRRSIRKKNR